MTFIRLLLDEMGPARAGPTDLILYQNVTVTDVKLPEALNSAITRKLTEQQNADAYQYILLQAQGEAERKRIEAVGIQTFYSIVANALSPQLLTWRGIEATVDIARSNNAKVVIVGGGRDQLPLILGGDIAKQPDVPNPPPVNPREYPLPKFDDMPKLFPDTIPRWLDSPTLSKQQSQLAPFPLPSPFPAPHPPLPKNATAIPPVPSSAISQKSAN
jgi:hypothetical protein